MALISDTNSSEAAAAHRHCDACTTYLPVDGAAVQCTKRTHSVMRLLIQSIGRVCKTYTCSQYDPSGCPRSTPAGVWDPVTLVEFHGPCVPS